MKILSMTVLLAVFSSCAVMAEAPDTQKLTQDTQSLNKVEGPDIQKLLRDTQITRTEKGKIDIIWWIPNEFWMQSFKVNKSLTPEKQKEFMDVLEKYMVFNVMEGTIGTFGSVTTTPKEELQLKTTVLVQGQTLTPLSEMELSDDMRTFLQAMKPVFANMLGKLGQGMEFIVFKAKNAKGERYADPRKEGLLVLKLADKEYRWRLPLGSLLPAKYDPKTREEFPGNYEYNPFTGMKLLTVKTNSLSDAKSK